MNKSLFITISILIAVSLLFSQFDNKQVLMNQIRRLQSRREFSRVLEIYDELIKQYPQDEEIIQGYFQTLISLNQIEAAESLLATYDKNLKGDKKTELNLVLLSKKGEHAQAKKLALDFLKQNPGVINLYLNFAGIFEQQLQFETAIELLAAVREISKDEYLFAQEMARNYEYSNNYSGAINEYLKHLEKNNGFLFLVTNKIKTFLSSDETLISLLENKLADSDNQVMLELYASALAHINDFDSALEIYLKLDAEKLLQFANELYSRGKYELAATAFHTYRENISDPTKKADAGIRIARLYINLSRYDDAETILMEIVNEKSIQDRRIRFRTKANSEARQLLAELAVRLNQDAKEVIKWYEDAKSYAFNQNEQKDLELAIVQYMIMKKEYEEAENRLKKTIANEPSGSHIHNHSYYQRFLLNLMTTQAPSDSLLTELVVKIPGSPFTSEALFLTVITNRIENTEQQSSFLRAYQMKNLYQDTEAVNTILETDIELLSEELIVLAAYWATMSGDYRLAESLYSHTFIDETLQGYAALRLSEVEKMKEKNYRETAAGFLQENPSHIFSPQLRLLLTRK